MIVLVSIYFSNFVDFVCIFLLKNLVCSLYQQITLMNDKVTRRTKKPR